MARIVAIMVVAVLAAMPAAAAAAPAPQQQSPVQQQPVPAPAPQPVPGPESTTFGPGTLLLIGLVIAALIGGIWFVIARDARRATAGRGHAQPGGDAGRSATRSARRSRKPSAAERQRRKRGRAR
jgi:hypothetical protein